MPAADAQNLTDTWHGRFTYPAGTREATSFVAHLEHSGTWLSGTIEERGNRTVRERRMTATLSGQVVGDAVTFMKVYDSKLGGYDKVFYAGVLRDEGLEISGTWTIPGNASSTFLMIRSRGLAMATERKVAERV